MNLGMYKISSLVRLLFRKRLKISSSVIHTNIKDFEFKINQKEAKNYNDAVKNGDKSVFKKDLHSLFYTQISWQIIENLNDYLITKIDNEILKTIIHLSEQFHYYKKIDVPQILTVKSKIWSVSPHKKGTKIIIKFAYYCDEELVAIEYSGGLLFGVRCIGKAQNHEKIPKTKIVEESPVWIKTISIDKELPFIYANKANIDAPIHTDSKFAKSIGLPNNILQGTCTFAKSLELIFDKEFITDLDQIKSVSSKFTGMVVPPNKITVRLLKKEINALYFDVLNNKKETVIKGGQILFKEN